MRYAFAPALRRCSDAAISAKKEAPKTIADCNQVNIWNNNRSLVNDDLWAPCTNCSGYANCFWCSEDSA